MFVNHLKFILPILFTVDVICTVLAEINAGDKGWWLVLLFVNVLFSTIYAVLFACISSSKGISVFPAGYIHITLALALLVLQMMAINTSYDWLAINNGAKMTLQQQLLQSSYTPVVMYVLAFVSALIVGISAKHTDVS